MAGHSQFANIKHRKEAQDAKRSKIFTKIQREIYSSIKACGGEANEAFNPRLRLAILKGRSLNMPKDKIDAAIKKATGVGMAENFENIRYDAFAQHGVGIIIEALTDNKNRTAGEVRAIITKHNGNMTETGSLDFTFKHIGVILYAKEGIVFDSLFETAVEIGAENVEEFDECFEITTKFEDFHKVQTGLVEVFKNPLSANIEYRANVPVSLSQEHLESINKFVDALEDLDDVQHVWASV